MAATSVPFQLFPPSVPQIRVNAPPSDHVVNFSRKTDPSSTESLVKFPNAESVVIKIVEDPEQRLEAYYGGDKRSRSASPEMRDETLPASPIDGHRPFSLSIPEPAKSEQPAPPPPGGDRATYIDPSPTSPVVPIRSMFPTYNPSLPLNQQRYFPQRATEVQRENVSREDYIPSRSPSRLDDSLGGPRTAPASLVDFPIEVLTTVQQPQFSSVGELEMLWAATNGAHDPESPMGDFNLRMSRAGEAQFTFGSTPSVPFYTLETFDTNELSISRTHPRRPTKTVTLLLLPLEPVERREPPNDGLVTYIFPKLAAMLAVEQSTALAAKHRLAPSEQEEMESDAVARAAAQEASFLRWNQHYRRYELAHPAIGRDLEKSPHCAVPPTSPNGAEQPVLHITVASNGLRSPLSTTSAPPVITVTNPNLSVAAQSSSPAELRMSTLPVSDTEEPLASLDFETMTLHISPSQILQLAPSLYAVDSVVAAILAVAVADEATNPIMASMDLWTPRTPRAPASVYCGSIAGSIGGKSYTGSILYATIAEREEAEEEAKMMRQLHKGDTKGKTAKTAKTSFWGKKSKPKKTKKQIVIGEFDLEKYGHYQAGSREGEELPGVVRGGLEMMFVGLKFFVWLLTMLVQMIAWATVSVTRCVTSEKF